MSLQANYSWRLIGIFTEHTLLANQGKEIFSYSLLGRRENKRKEKKIFKNFEFFSHKNQLKFKIFFSFSLFSTQPSKTLILMR